MARCGCAGSGTCNCVLKAGANVTISGVGTASSPYVVNAGTDQVDVADTSTVDLEITGASPAIITATVKLDPSVNNVLTTTANGLSLTCADIQDCFVGNTIVEEDSDTVDLTFVAGPNTLTADVNVDPAVGNLISIVPGAGLRVDCAAVAGCISLNVADTTSVDMTLAGTGTAVDPWIVSGEVNISNSVDNILVLNPDGLFVACCDAGDAFTAGPGIDPVQLAANQIGTLLSTDIDPDTGLPNQLTYGTDGGLLLFPECYAPRMTRAEAIARGAAGLFHENCHVVITDAPSIGCNPTATEVELHPNTPSTLALEGRMTPLGLPGQGVWDVQYDIVQNIYVKIEDEKGNIVEAGNSAQNVMAEFPFGFSNVSGNHINSGAGGVNLTGWCVPAAAGVNITNNVVDGATGLVTVDLTGVTAGNAIYGNKFEQRAGVTLINDAVNYNFVDNYFHNSGTPSVFDTTGATVVGINANQTFNGGSINLQASGASVVFANNQATDGGVLGVTGSGNMNIAGNRITNSSSLTWTGGAANLQANANYMSGGARTELNSTLSPGGSWIYDENDSIDGFFIRVAPTGALTGMVVNANHFRGTDVLLPAVPQLLVDKPAGQFFLDQDDFDTDAAVQTWRFGGSNSDDVRLTEWKSPTIVTPMVSTGAGAVQVREANIRNTPFNLTGAGNLFVLESDVNSSLVTLAGSGLLQIARSTVEGVRVANSAASTRGLAVNDVLAHGGTGVINQTRTGGTGIDFVQHSTITNTFGGNVLLLAGAVGGAGNQTVLNRSTITNGSDVTITDPTAGTVIEGSQFSYAVITSTGATGLQWGINVQSATLNLAGFPHNSVNVAGNFVNTLTATNNNTFRGYGVNTLV